MQELSEYQPTSVYPVLTGASGTWAQPPSATCWASTELPPFEAKVTV